MLQPTRMTNALASGVNGASSGAPFARLFKSRNAPLSSYRQATVESVLIGSAEFIPADLLLNDAAPTRNVGRLFSLRFRFAFADQCTQITIQRAAPFDHLRQTQIRAPIGFNDYGSTGGWRDIPTDQRQIPRHFRTKKRQFDGLFPVRYASTYQGLPGIRMVFDLNLIYARTLDDPKDLASCRIDLGQQITRTPKIVRQVRLDGQL